MKLRDRAHQLAVVCSLIAASSFSGCGGGGETPSADTTASSASSGGYSGPATAPTSPPPATSDPGGNGESSGGGGGPPGMLGPGNTEQGMPDSGMAGMGMGGMGMGMAPPSSSPSDPSSGYGSGGMGMGTGMGATAPDLSSLLGMGAPNNAYGGGQGAPVDPAPSEDDDYMTKAKYAFAIGKEAAAEQYYYAHLLAHEDEATQLLEQVRWSPGERRPATTVRFAVGVQLEAPAGVQDYRPIGRSQMAGNAAGGDGMASGYAMGAEMGQPGQAKKGDKTLGDLTGKFGEELLTAFETAWDNGDLGTAFKDVEAIEPVKAKPNNTSNPYGMGMSGMGMGGMDSSMMPTYGGDGAYGAQGDNAAADKSDVSLRMRAVPGKSVVPGLLYVGTGSVAELEEKAQQEGIEFLFLFEVIVKPTRGLIHNDTRLRLVYTKDNEAIGATSSLNNLKVDRAMAMKSDSDDVAKQVSNLFRKAETLKLTDFPKLEPMHAQARIKSLLEKKSENVLQTLMEIRLFHSMGLLDEVERDAAYQLAMGGAGVAFASGTVEDRQFVLDPLLPAYK